LRADRIGGRSGAESGIAVTIELAAPADRLAVFVRATGLSPREAGLVGLVVDGLDGKEVAARMFLSPHTVQDHLKSVFAKTDSIRNLNDWTLIQRSIFENDTEAEDELIGEERHNHNKGLAPAPDEAGRRHCRFRACARLPWFAAPER